MYATTNEKKIKRIVRFADSDVETLKVTESQSEIKHLTSNSIDTPSASKSKHSPTNKAASNYVSRWSSITRAKNWPSKITNLSDKTINYLN